MAGNIACERVSHFARIGPGDVQKWKKNVKTKYASITRKGWKLGLDVDEGVAIDDMQDGFLKHRNSKTRELARD